MSLERRAFVGDEVKQAALFVHTQQRALAAVAHHHPRARRQRVQQPAVEVIQVQVLEAAAAGGPDELLAARQERQLVVQVDPGLRAFRQQRRARAGVRVDFQQVESALVARLALHGEVCAVGKPVDARQIDVAVRAEVDRRHHAVRQLDQPELDEHVGGAGRGVALLDHHHVVGADLEALPDLDRGCVDARESDAALVRRPPVAGVAAHLLLRDEFRGGVRNRSLAVAAERPFLAAAQVDDEQVLVAYETHEPAPRREFRVGLGSGRIGEAAHGALRRGGEVVVVQIPAQRKEQCLAVGSEQVLDDPGKRGNPLALAALLLFGRQRPFDRHQPAGIDEQAHLARGEVEFPQVELVLVVRLAAQERDTAAVGRDLRRAQVRAVQVGGGEDALDRQGFRARGLGIPGAPAQQHGT